VTKLKKQVVDSASEIKQSDHLGEIGNTAKISSSSETGQLRDHMFNEQVRMVYATANPGIMHSLLVAVVGWMYWGIAEPTNFAIWLALAISVSAIRLFVVWSFVRLNPADEQLVLWDQIYLVAVFVTGITWGLAGVLLYPPDDIVYQVALAFVVGGISASATASLSARYPAIWLAVTPAMLFLTARFLWDAGEGHFEMGVMLLLYFVVLMNIGRSMNKQVLEALSLRFEKQDLVRSLEKTVNDLEFARREAEQSSRSKTRFLASASHDLRQPVHALQLFVAALARRTSGNADEQDLLGKINRSMDNMSDLLDSLLDVSKLDAGVVQPRIEPIDLQSLLIQIANEFDGEAEERGLYVRVGGVRATIESDAILLGRILRNLVSNAVRYTEKGGVLLGARPRGDFIHIEIWDTGLGIGEENRDEVFQEFFQLRRAADDRQGGLGLGLAIVKRTADLVGHELKLDSTLGQGTRFTIIVPRSLGQRTSSPSPEILMQNLEGFGENFKVLLIEDDPLSAEAMIALLEGWGCECALAATQAEVEPAIARLGGTASLIISDFRLPDEVTGDVAVAHSFEVLGHKVPTLIITGDTGPERLRALDGTGFPVLHKPVQPAQLRSVLRHLLASPAD